MRKIAAIDGNSLMHRAFHAVPPTMNAPDGRPTNACFGFLSMLLKFIEEFKPDVLVCAFDAGVPAFRLEAIEKYKAQRPPTDPDLKVQFPIIEELLGAMSVPVLRIQGWEGDDILGTVAAQTAGLPDSETFLVTGDKDALQLVDERTFVVNTRTGMSDIAIYDSEAVIERFGVPPERVADFLGLMGDASDNIPGVPGVGPKTATKLLVEYGSMDAVLAHAEEIKGKLGENLRANRDQALASREVATIIADVPLELAWEELSFPRFDAQAVRETFSSYGFITHLNKVLKLVGASAGAGAAASGAGAGTSGGYATSDVDVNAKSTAEWLAFEQDNVYQGSAALELLRKIVGRNSQRLAAHLQKPATQTLFDNESSLYVAADPEILVFDDHALYAQALALIAESGQLVAFQTKDLLQQAIGRDSSRPPGLDLAQLSASRLTDLSLAAYLLDSNKIHDSVFSLAADYLPGFIDPRPQDRKERKAQRTLEKDRDLGIGAALATRALAEVLAGALSEDGSERCYREIEMPLVPVLLGIEYLGVNVEPEQLKALSRDITQTIDSLRAQAFAEAGEEFNLDSPKQLAEILFNQLKLPARKKRSTGYSTDASVLAELKELHPLPGIMLEYRELAKLKNTYLDTLPALMGDDGHIHTTFNQAVVTTGRLSSSDPNLQNIPVRSDLGREIRRAFIPDAAALGVQHALFLSADYSQIELRLLAHLSGDERLITAFTEGEDFHAETAARVFGVPVSEVSAQMRSRAKAVNFGIVYGQQAYGLSQSLGISYQEAQEMIDRYFAAYPDVRAYLDSCVEQAHQQGWVETIFGRKRHIQELTSSNQALRGFGQRTAMNHPLQGSAADIIKLAMIEVARRISEAGLVSQMVLQVHDELDFNCAADELEELSALVKTAMEKIVPLKVPLLVEVSSGANWAEAH
ncbi:MAG: DNA polymerase I [Coriobacteriales bacterium]|jgi:DNA polymerase-1|nr:DNA polymerase I [Coriobacteriales bacterium]